ncbi:MAG: oligoendopeptidase F, partial [Bacteroidota bacterium]
QIPAQYRWDLTHLFSSDDAWRAEKQRVVGMFPSLAAFQGSLGASSKRFLECLELYSQLGQRLAKLHARASMASDEDTRNSLYLGMQQEIQQVYADFGSNAAFIEPEILRLGPAAVNAFLDQEKGLEPYRFFVADILRRKEHTGTESEEKIIADAALMASAPQDIYGVFSNADFPYPDVVLSSGATVRMTPAAFSLHRASPVREDRRAVMQTFFRRLHDYRLTFGVQLNAEVKKDLFYRKARRYPSCLEASLDANRIPVAVYHNLIDGVREHLPTFHRYLALRRRILGLDQLRYYDLYAPLLADVPLSYTVEQARAHILASLEPLGDEYRAVARKAFDERWVDLYPTAGKRSGAYSNGSAYDVHPYILMNYNGKYDDMSTLTHELGHTMHSYYSNARQPWIAAQYSIFVAEVASTFNEALLIDHMLRTIDDDAVRLSLLGNELESMKGTVFRQTQFAEFELAIHERAERGEALTGDAFSDIYREIVERAYGHHDGVCVVDDEIRAEWAYIPHFYYTFYVYQYATSYTASVALSERVLAGDAETTRRYLAFLGSGGSDYPIDQLRAAGVDMTSSEPLTLTMRRMNRIMDNIESLLTKMRR